jgi:hypothetical protein
MIIKGGFLTMGTKRVGLARMEALMENLDRALDLEGSDVTVNSLISDLGVTVTAGDVSLESGTLRIKNGTTVAQATNKSTTVVSNTEAGKITMNGASLTADAIVTFTVTCSPARATDIVLVNHHSGGTVGKYLVQATGAAAGSFKITVTNISGGSLSEALVLHYSLIKIAHT